MSNEESCQRRLSFGGLSVPLWFLSGSDPEERWCDSKVMPNFFPPRPNAKLLLSLQFLEFILILLLSSTSYFAFSPVNFTDTQSVCTRKRHSKDRGNLVKHVVQWYKFLNQLCAGLIEGVEVPCIRHMIHNCPKKKKTARLFCCLSLPVSCQQSCT